MSHKIVLTVDSESRTLLTYSNNYFRTKLEGYNYSMVHPQVFGGLFYISLEATDNDELFYYWLKSGEMMNGSIEFYRTVDEDDIPFQRIDFWDAFLVRIKEQTTQGSYPMTMECDISAAIVRHNRNDATLLRKSWYVTNINEKPIDIYVSDAEEQEPEITKICFKDADGNEIIDNIPTDGIVSLYAETVGFNEGDDVVFKIELLSGETTVKAKIGKDGIVEIKNYKLIL